MLIRPWDAALDEFEWRDWLGLGHDFGQLAANGQRGEPPVMVPVHFAIEGNEILVHLAQPNPIWRAIEARPETMLSVVDDYAFVPSTWRAKAGSAEEDGVPTSYYAAVQFSCLGEIIDDPSAKAELLRLQLAHFQPKGDHAPVAADLPPYGPMLAGIRGLRLSIREVRAKFKYDDHNPVTHRQSVAGRLEARNVGRDKSAAAEQRWRAGRVGEWKGA